MKQEDQMPHVSKTFATPSICTEQSHAYGPETRQVRPMPGHHRIQRRIIAASPRSLCTTIHPMLVLSPKALNERTGIVIGLPMTTAKFNDTNPFAIKFKGPRNVTSYVLAHQPKSLDWRARGAKAHP